MRPTVIVETVLKYHCSSGSMEKRWVQIFVLISWIISANTNDHKQHTRHKRYQEGECGHLVGVVSLGNIVGGYDIGYYKYPWYVALMRGNEQLCGGTLISSRFILTAAHCFQPFFNLSKHGWITLEESLVPTMGVYNICRHEMSQKRFKVEKVYVHEDYVHRDPYYDITLIKLQHEATDFQPCCLPTKVINSKDRPREALIYGLGDLAYGTMKVTCTMHEARILIYNDTVCKKMLLNLEEDPDELVNAFCAGYLEGGIDACQGDSGGGLTVMGSGGRYYVLGITSFGYECATPNTLGVYTDVSKYLDWIHDKMQTSTLPTTTSTTKTSTTTTITTPTVNIVEITTTADEMYQETTFEPPDEDGIGDQGEVKREDGEGDGKEDEDEYHWGWWKASQKPGTERKVAR